MKKPAINIKKILVTLLWCAIGVAGIVLLQAGMHSQAVKTCKEVSVSITGVSNNFFIDKADVKNIIKNYTGGEPVGKTLQSFNLKDIENQLEKDTWIKNAELYFDNNDVLRVHVDEREPAARLFATDGGTFYIDTSITILPLSEKFSARLPVFTGFPKSSGKFTAADSSLLRAVLQVSEQLQADSFLMAMIDQVDITPQGNFELVPKIGNQTIVLGDATDVAEKFAKLKMFYSKVISVAGWSKYSSINLQYKNQVVAKMKDAADKSADSLRTLQIMQLIAERAAKQAEDSSIHFAADNEKNSGDGSMIEQSIERDEPEAETGYIQDNAAIEHVEKPATILAKPEAKKVAGNKPAQKPSVKPAAKPKPAAQQPKVVMPKNN